MTLPRKPVRRGRSPYRVQVLDRVVAVLTALVEEGTEPALTQLSHLLHLHKSTAHRLIMALEGHKLIQRDLKRGGYRLGVRLFELGMCAISQLGICAHARPILECLVQETNETVRLWVYDDCEVVCVDEMEPSQSIRLATTLGRRDSAFCTAAGMAMIATMSEEQIDASVQEYGLRPVMKKRIGLSSRAAFMAELANVRSAGYAVDDEESEEGVCCVGAPVLAGPSKDLVAAISVSGPSFRIPAYKIPRLAKTVIASAARLSEALGYQAQAPWAQDIAETKHSQSLTDS